MYTIFNCLCPGGFTACAESAAWAFLALLFKKQQLLCLSLLSPLLLKVEPPNFAHLIKNEQKTLC